VKTSDRHAMAPPRLVLGAALLFWGGVTDHPMVGLLCAFLVESRSWFRWRWDFGERGFVRAWSLCVVAAALTVAGLWLQGESILMLFRILVWMPLFFLPLMLAQQYAIDPRMPLNTFSFIARRKMHLDRAAGRTVEPVQIHFGYVYFCLVIMASALGRVSEAFFFAGLLILAALALFFASPVARRRPVGWSVAFGSAAAAGLGVAAGLVTLYQALGGLYQMAGTMPPAGDRIRTAIGQLGRVKLSYGIRWRVREDEPGGRHLFREAVYNRYGLGHWTHRPMRAYTPRMDYEIMESLTGEADRKQFAFRPEEFQLDPLSRRRLTLRGEVSSFAPLPVPEATQRIGRVRGPDALLEYNSLGTLRLTNPGYSVVDLDVYYGGAILDELPPASTWDLQIPAAEREGMARVCRDWGLDRLPDREVVARIRKRFQRDFEYTLHLGYRAHTGPRYSQAVTRFLEGDGSGSGRRGHCEYFATAAALLLREAGIPARYCVGFSAQEKDSRTGEWILRGRHAHAWCRVYLGGTATSQTDPDSGETRLVWEGGRWTDFDPTPPGWFAIEGSGVPWERRLLDWWQRAREDFLIWRTTPGNSSIVNWTMLGIGILLAAYIAWRLAGTRTTRSPRARGGNGDSRPAVVTPLHDLARSAERWLGPRADAQTFTRWILRLGELVPGARPALHRAVRYHWKARFDPLGLDPAEQGEFLSLCHRLKSRLRELRRSGSRFKT